MLRPHRFVGETAAEKLKRSRGTIRVDPHIQLARSSGVASLIPQPPGSKQNAQMRWRTDGNNWAEFRALGTLTDEEFKRIYGESEFRNYLNTPPAEPGDTWRIEWSTEGNLLAGYAICCPRCKHIHYWTTANNCHLNEKEFSFLDAEGKEIKYKQCEHSWNHGSCWKWSGDPTQNKLTAQPSLHCTSEDCGWHGFLTDGFLREC